MPVYTMTVSFDVETAHEANSLACDVEMAAREACPASVGTVTVSQIREEEE